MHEIPLSLFKVEFRSKRSGVRSGGAFKLCFFHLQNRLSSRDFPNLKLVIATIQNSTLLSLPVAVFPLPFVTMHQEFLASLIHMSNLYTFCWIGLQFCSPLFLKLFILSIHFTLTFFVFFCSLDGTCSQRKKAGGCIRSPRRPKLPRKVLIKYFTALQLH